MSSVLLPERIGPRRIGARVFSLPSGLSFNFAVL